MSNQNRVFSIDKLGYQNVVSSRKKIHYTEMDSFYKSFISLIVDKGYTIKGPYFYSLNGEPKDGMMDIEMFMPIAENKFVCGGHRFQSYFEIIQLVTTAIKGNIAQNTETAYASLLQVLEENDLNVATPFYHVMPIAGSHYVNLYLGYYKES